MTLLDPEPMFFALKNCKGISERISALNLLSPNLER
jgi:hypothetical protein